MSVILVNNDDFYGYLARRTASGQVKYQYFSLSKKVGKSFVPVTEAQRKKILREAETYDVELLEWQTQIKQKAKEKCKPSKRNNTGVKGIILSRKENSETLSFVVAVVDETGKPVMRSFNIDYGWKRAWKYACTFLGEAKGIPVAKIIQKVPSQQIKELVN